MQKSVSTNSFKKCAYVILPWWLLCFSVWCGSLFTKNNCNDARRIEIAFFLIAFLPIVILCFLVYTRKVYTRVHMTSRMHRGAFDFLLVFSIFYLSSNIVIYKFIGIDRNKVHEVTYLLSSSIISSLWSCFFPYAMFLCLYADTKYWRGIGKRNVGGIRKNSLHNTQQPTMTVNVVSTDFQDMMSNVSDTVLDYAFIRVEDFIAKGATAEVYRAVWKNKLQIAMKVYTPSEITKDVIEELVLEGKVAIQLKHKNIVRYYGVCIRPPQISMVMEYCSKGDLKTSIQKHPENWPKVSRIKACLEAARAIKYIHKLEFIHRDIKASNFFVTEDNVVKLGDFGESTKKRSIESTESKRMSILGTVPFMAPEIINADRHYTEAIDIYALGITFWEIWTGEDPYGNVSTFDIYNYVKEGKRPPFKDDMPDDFVEILSSTWLGDADARPSARILVIQLKKCLVAYIQNNNIDPSLFASELDAVNRITDGSSDRPTMGRRLSNFVKRMSLIGTPIRNTLEREPSDVDFLQPDDDEDEDIEKLEPCINSSSSTSPSQNLTFLSNSAVSFNRRASTSVPITSSSTRRASSTKAKSPSSPQPDTLSPSLVLGTSPNQKSIVSNVVSFARRATFFETKSDEKSEDSLASKDSLTNKADSKDSMASADLSSSSSPLHNV